MSQPTHTHTLNFIREFNTILWLSVNWKWISVNSINWKLDGQLLKSTITTINPTKYKMKCYLTLLSIVYQPYQTDQTWQQTMPNSNDNITTNDSGGNIVVTTEKTLKMKRMEWNGWLAGKQKFHASFVRIIHWVIIIVRQDNWIRSAVIQAWKLHAYTHTHTPCSAEWMTSVHCRLCVCCGV